MCGHVTKGVNKVGTKLRLVAHTLSLSADTAPPPSLTHTCDITCSYVTKGFDKVGTKLKLVVRGKANDAEVVKMPFVPTNYYKGEGK